MTTVSLDSGKYVFEINEETLQLRNALRYGENWPAGMELQYSKVVMCMLWRLTKYQQLIELLLKADTQGACDVGEYLADAMELATTLAEEAGAVS